jgi:hypothetical protein
MVTIGSCQVVCRCCRYSIAIMVDTEGSEVHTGELAQPIKTEVGGC